MRHAILIAVCFLFVCQAPAQQPAQQPPPDLKKLKLFTERYKGQTLVLENVQYLHKIERQENHFTFHVTDKEGGVFLFMLKEAANDGSFAMITSGELAEKLLDSKLDGLPKTGQGWYPVKLTCKIESIEVNDKPLWVGNVSQVEFLDKEGAVAKTVK